MIALLFERKVHRAAARSIDHNKQTEGVRGHTQGRYEKMGTNLYKAVFHNPVDSKVELNLASMEICDCDLRIGPSSHETNVQHTMRPVGRALACSRELQTPMGKFHCGWENGTMF